MRIVDREDIILTMISCRRQYVWYGCIFGLNVGFLVHTLPPKSAIFLHTFLLLNMALLTDAQTCSDGFLSDLGYEIEAGITNSRIQSEPG